MTAVWEAGHTYVPGSLVRPITNPPVTGGQPANPSFEDGSTSWTLGTGYSVTAGTHYDGTHALQYDGTGSATALSTDKRPVFPGQTITASCMVQQGASSSGKAAGAVVLIWYDINGAQLSPSQGNVISSGSGGKWGKSSVTAKAPEGASFVAIAGTCTKNSGSSMWLDTFSWDYAYSAPSGGLVYKAVQPAAGKSAANEPAWPPTLGQQVIDNEVIWEAVTASQIVWMARPINKSGAFEPDWPRVANGFVHDGTMDWTAVTPQIKDANCPRSKIVAIAASKVYAADKDIIRYCATVNPLDWSTEDDAGYLPYGLQTYGSNPVAAMNLYRSNIAAFNAEGMQLWQVDEDPAQTALLDALPVGSTQNQALSPVSNDLIFLSSQGVRSIGVTSSSTNLQAGDIGMPIDPLVKEAVANSPSPPLATYVPPLGQYWLAIAEPAAPGPTIAGALGNGYVGDVIDFHYTITAVGPYTVTLISGHLPDGLTMDATGHVTGTRASDGTAVPVIRVTDANGRIVTKTDPSTTFAGPPVYHGTFLITAVAGDQEDSVPLEVPKGEWKFVIADMDIGVGEVSLYVDNVLIGTKSIDPITRPERDLTVAGTDRNEEPTFQCFRGLLWGAGVYNGAMSQDDRDALWNGGDGVKFATLAGSNPDLFAAIVYAWQLDDAAGAAQLAEAHGRTPLTVLPPGSRAVFMDAERGNVSQFNHNGCARAVGTAVGSLETADRVSYFAWVYSGVQELDSFPGIITRYAGIGDFMGLRSFWVSN